MYKMNLEVCEEEAVVIEYLIENDIPLPIVMQAAMLAIDGASSQLLDINNECDLALMKSAAQANGLSMQTTLKALNMQKGIVDRLAALFTALETEQDRLHLITAFVVKLYTGGNKGYVCKLN